MTAASPPVAPVKGSKSGTTPGGGFSWAALLFLGPAALLLIVFLVYPALTHPHKQLSPTR